tara:strand:+ start:183 stop:305 length:123 start_codon:yes stop_codon:yes gene_type:complete
VVCILANEARNAGMAFNDSRGSFGITEIRSLKINGETLSI